MKSMTETMAPNTPNTMAPVSGGIPINALYNEDANTQLDFADHRLVLPSLSAHRFIVDGLDGAVNQMSVQVRAIARYTIIFLRPRTVP